MYDLIILMVCGNHVLILKDKNIFPFTVQSRVTVLCYIIRYFRT